MATDNLLQDFPPVSTEAWENAIAKDLKGADYARKLIWQSGEGLAVKPYYRLKTLPRCKNLAAPGDYPFLRGTNPTGDSRIREEIDATNPEQANKAAQSAVNAGTEEIAFLNTVVRNSSDLGLLLANLSAIPVHFPNAGEPLLRLLIDRFKSRKDPQNVSTGWNPLSDPGFATDIIRTAPPL